MKRFSLLVMALLMLAPMTYSQNIFGLISKSVLHYYPGVVTFKDGHTEEYAAIGIPNTLQTTLKVSDDPKHKKTKEFESHDIFCIDVHHQNYPEKVMRLYYVELENLIKIGHEHAWCILEETNSWGAHMTYYQEYDFNKKGVLVGLGNEYGKGQRIFKPYTHEKGVAFVGLSNKPMLKIFEGNESIIARIKSGKYKWEDFEYMCEEMARFEASKHGGESSAPVVATPETTETTATSETTETSESTEVEGDDM